MYNKKEGIKISIQIKDIETTWESPYSDENAHDLIEAFIGMLITHTYSKEGIEDYIIEKGQELSINRNNEK